MSILDRRSVSIIFRQLLECSYRILTPLRHFVADFKRRDIMLASGGSIILGR
jgi:hypothetical protein